MSKSSIVISSFIGFLTNSSLAGLTGAGFKASSSANFSSTSILGNITSPLTTLSPATVPLNSFKLSQVVTLVFNWAFIFTLVSVKNGEIITETNLKVSNKLYKTVPSLSFFSSSLASIQGVVSSIYLLALLIKVHMLSNASGIFNASILASTFPGVDKAKFINSSSIASLHVGAWITPSKYL